MLTFLEAPNFIIISGLHPGYKELDVEEFEVLRVIDGFHGLLLELVKFLLAFILGLT